ncbi:MAG: iron ABC transporter permease [Dehalococcoidia bacterium]|nr:iron ABC transporter permease [Dehalococcoidia bacterium]MCB9486782.1 iron ABC transporter permease [Thermoflexaceae bacterium]
MTFRFGRRGRQAPGFLWIPAVAVGLLSLAPVYYLAVRSTERGWEPWRDVAERSLWPLLVDSLQLAVVVVACSLAIALPGAWLTVRTDLPWRRAWAVALALPLAIPSYVMGLAVVAALGPRGLLQDWLQPLGVERLPEIYGLPAATLTLTAVSYPYLYIVLRAALRAADPSIEEAARSLGSGRLRAFASVTLPALMPAIAAGSLLVALYALSDFGGVATVRYTTFTRAVFLEYTSSFDRSRAAVLGVMLGVLAVTVLMLELLARSRYQSRLRSARTAPSTPIPLGRWRWPATGYLAIIVLVSEVLPVFVLCWWLGRGIAAGTDLPDVRGPLEHTLTLGLAGAAITTVLALAPAVLSARYGGFMARVVEQATFIAHALPGLVIALALVFFGIAYARPLYQTTWMLLLAYVVLFVPNALAALRAPLLRQDPHLEDAAASLGRRPFSTLATVTLPLARPGASAAFVLVFLTIVKELPATLLLSPPGYRTLAGVTWSTSSEAFLGSAALPGLLIIGLAALPAAVLAWRGDDESIER